MNACQIIDEYIIDEFIKQGHELTGDWQNSIIHKEISDSEVQGFAKIYGLIINEGIQPSRIPYGNSNNGQGEESKYILGLARYWKLRKPEISDKKALQLAFATAEVQKKEGMSTISAEQFSANGKRQQFLSSLNILFNDYLDNWIFEGLDFFINSESKERKTIIM